MNTTDKLNLIVGLGLIVVGTAGLYACMRAADRLANHNIVDIEKIRQDTWDDITRKPFYEKLSADDQIRFYDAFWKPNEK